MSRVITEWSRGPTHINSADVIVLFFQSNYIWLLMYF